MKHAGSDRRDNFVPMPGTAISRKAAGHPFCSARLSPGCVVLLGLLAAAACVPALPQLATAQTSARSPASLFDTAQKAFESLPMDKRREIQEGLIWSGHYKGGVDGEFGRMTMGAIQAYEARGKGPRDGVLSLQDIAALTAAANRQKAQLGFQDVVDPRSGIRIGVPARILKRRNLRDGSIFESSDKGITLRTFEAVESRQSLADLYEYLSEPVRGRRVTYRILRDDFLVVSTLDRGRFYYTRVARGPSGKLRPNEMRTGSDAMLRGYTLSISQAMLNRQRVQMDILTIAISNSFDPFPSAVPTTAGSSKAGTATAAGGPGELKPVDAVQEILVATAVTVANDTYLTVLDPKSCKTVRIGKAPAKHVASDPATGLALYSAPVGGGRPLQSIAAGDAAAGQDALVLFAELPSPGANRQISFARGSFAVSAGKTYVKIIAPDSAAGGVAVNAQGFLAGLIVQASPNRRKVAGPVPPPSRSMLAPATISAFLAKAGIGQGLFSASATAIGHSAGKSSPGAIAQTYSRSLAAVWCVKN